MGCDIRNLLSVTGSLALAVPMLSSCAEQADHASCAALEAVCAVEDATEDSACAAYGAACAAGEAACAAEGAACAAAWSRADCARPDEGDPECEAAACAACAVAE